MTDAKPKISNPETEANWIFNRLEIQGKTAVLTRKTRGDWEPRTRKIDKDTYLDKESGEVKEYHHKQNRAQNTCSLRRSFSKIRAIVNTNATDPSTVKFITLTYAENMEDPKQLYKDFKAFWRRFKTWAEKKGQKKPEYLLVVEPQKRGAWHGHLLLFYGDEKAPFIPFKDLLEMWGKGYVWISKIDDVENLASYLCAYLTDVRVRGGSAGAGREKAVLKGLRVYMYPTGMNIYRHSRGIKKPETYMLHQSYADLWQEDHEATYSVDTMQTDRGTGEETLVHKDWYTVGEDVADWLEARGVPKKAEDEGGKISGPETPADASRKNDATRPNMGAVKSDRHDPCQKEETTP